MIWLAKGSLVDILIGMMESCIASKRPNCVMRPPVNIAAVKSTWLAKVSFDAHIVEQNIFLAKGA
jgi:hypothetical protein